MAEQDVTKDFQWCNPDDELLPITKCACGHRYQVWEKTLSVYAEDPQECEHCHRRFYFRQAIEVIEVL